ncbi:ABC-type multidrug transport system, ATPase and permease component [Methylobacillus rhizosphaerae]|uniref:Cyclolysin secretion/processing ATP-binding protein CyaB n=1 Tax=Methylobacillus rhizosphaerae TaxID=551994 RepID=A0A238ZQT8_9PROT|nr:ABC transporter ATP-binding protein [Methylobacillus rhizosphaerae]SNR85512.1 ABC-type multidrug transport system, ATPase and permease component [Methylobacillus rhizosphaerae]
MKLHSYPLLRCLSLYRRTPIRFLLSTALFALANLMLVWQQGMIARALHDVERGVAVVIDAAGGLDISMAVHWLMVIVAIASGRALVMYFVGWLSLTIQQDLLGHLREMILVQVQRLDLAYHWLHGAGEIVTRTTRDADKLRDALISFWRQVVDTAFIVAAAIGFLFWYHPWLGVGPLLLTSLGFYILFRQADHLVQLDRAVGRAFDHVNQDLTEGVNGVRVIKAFGLEASRVRKFERHVQFFVSQALEALRYSASRIPLPQFIVGLGQVWVLGIGAYLVADQHLNYGELVAALLMSTTLVFRVEGVGRVIQVFADARSSAARIWELLDAVPEIADGTRDVVAGRALGVRMQHINVAPPGGGNLILQDCSLELKPGEIVALVGATGSGKSTLASLLPRLVDASHGTITLGAEDEWHEIREFRLDSLRRAIHVVPQESFLFSDTLAANLRLAAPSATEEELLWALHLASANEVLDRLEHGLETRIGDRGITLSGGQRQRICLARALISKPAILVLDDATSALDAVTERTVLNNIRSLSDENGQAVSVLMIASKLSTILLADRVLMLSGGRIVAEGTHADLVTGNAEYRQLLGVEHGHG